MSIEHSYIEKARLGRAVVVIATTHITTRHGKRQQQQAHAVDAVAVDSGQWRATGMVV